MFIKAKILFDIFRATYTANISYLLENLLTLNLYPKVSTFVKIRISNNFLRQLNVARFQIFLYLIAGQKLHYFLYLF